MAVAVAVAVVFMSGQLQKLRVVDSPVETFSTLEKKRRPTCECWDQSVLT